MAIDVNWVTKVIFVPKADTTLIQASPEIREFDVLQFHLDLRTIQAAEGQLYPTTHNHITGPVLSGTQYADVVEVLNPYTVEFEDGQYTVKVTGANNNIVDVKVANQVSVATENSAGLIAITGGGGGWDQLVSDYLDPGTFGLSQAEQEYAHRIHIDVTGGAPGTTYPLGTHGNPVNNLADALTLAAKFRCYEIMVMSPLTLYAGASGFKFVGLGESALVNVNGQALTDVEFERCTVTGDAAACGPLRVIECWVSALANARGVFFNSILLDSLTASGSLRLLDCASGVAGQAVPYVDMMGVAGATFEARRYSGGLDLRGMANVSNVASVELNGQMILGPTNVQGSISLRGIGTLSDTSGPNFTVSDEAFLNLARIADRVWNGITI